jgi:phosphotransferase system HPr (HPr) family protein
MMLTPSPHASMAKVLVVDDDRDTAETMARLLEFLGHDVQIALDGHQAIEIARHQRPNYVLLDLGLPGMDGYQVASTLRQDLAGPLAIIAVTGFGQEEDRRRTLAAGFDHHFVKPIDHHALLAMLSTSNTGPPPSIPAGIPPEAMDREETPTFLVNRQVEIINALGLHLRAADKIVRLARQFRAEVRIARDGRQVSGRSILDLLTLAAGCGSRLELETDGPDAGAAMDALSGLIEHGFDEPGP